MKTQTDSTTQELKKSEAHAPDGVGAASEPHGDSSLEANGMPRAVAPTTQAEGPTQSSRGTRVGKRAATEDGGRDAWVKQVTSSLLNLNAPLGTEAFPGDKSANAANGLQEERISSASTVLLPQPVMTDTGGKVEASSSTSADRSSTNRKLTKALREDAKSHGKAVARNRTQGVEAKATTAIYIQQDCQVPCTVLSEELAIRVQAPVKELIAPVTAAFARAVQTVFTLGLGVPSDQVKLVPELVMPRAENVVIPDWAIQIKDVHINSAALLEGWVYVSAFVKVINAVNIWDGNFDDLLPKRDASARVLDAAKNFRGAYGGRKLEAAGKIVFVLSRAEIQLPAEIGPKEELEEDTRMRKAYGEFRSNDKDLRTAWFLPVGAPKAKRVLLSYDERIFDEPIRALVHDDGRTTRIKYEERVLGEEVKESTLKYLKEVQGSLLACTPDQEAGEDDDDFSKMQ